MERKALGRGLGALITENQIGQKNEMRNVQIRQIKPNPFQPRQDFNPAAIAELAESIKEKGVIQPLLVRQQGEFYELIAGERRLRAVMSLGLEEVPVLIKEATDQDSLEIALIENIQREELNPIEEAHAYQYLIDKFQVTQEKIGQILGKTRTSITNILRLLNLPQEIQEEIKKGKISFAHGRVLLEVQDAVQQRIAAQELILNSLSVRELENFIRMRRIKKAVKRSVNPGLRDPDILLFEEELRNILATKVSIKKNRKRGSIQIEFYSPEDLLRIINRIKGGITS